MILKIIIFLILNFAALLVGGLFTGAGVTSDWYTELNKAPWTPPGWVFGAAWTTIMVCFSFYMALLWQKMQSKKQLGIEYALQWVLNVIWNPLFFYLHLSGVALISIAALTILVFYFLFKYGKELKALSFLIVPYALWLLIAVSLNAYAYFYN